MENPAITPAVPAPAGRGRIWEIDFVRGATVIIMFYVHFMQDFMLFTDHTLMDMERGVGAVIANLFVLFFFVSGISSTFSRSNVRRGLRVGAVAIGLSIFTYFATPELFIRFGVLHFFAVCMIAWPLYRRWNWIALVAAGAVIFGLGIWFRTLTVGTEWLFPFGLTSPTFSSGDYFPLFPWAGVFLWGVAAGKTIYKERRSLIKRDIRYGFVSGFLGRHTLVIYIVHQPIIIGVVWVICRLAGWEFYL